jgi:hypothetical protein
MIDLLYTISKPFEVIIGKIHCSELVATAYQLSGIDLVKSSQVMGLQEIIPTSFKQSLKLEQIFMSRSCAEKL